ncbi:putative FeS-containing Cyanobacterial-specific oxidoreductase [Synechococcus sp. PCC 7335]|uniref:TIGR03279 family radical SAM protein n=1 Tax=Synechococcus sp. (strain ATCC 29403 / PCC 7335) TaxID=91464 RepID=UPI00017ED5CD|nr:TIGR03279 family radical SAM protein [Synechococcus sp. PCC 7335]EDX87444.1 putative FeS-containing Cyanobacterial-specific oxidoreductase [Synechococcus sp. PCC 7335]
MKTTTLSPAKVTSVVSGSIAEEIGFEAGDRLVSVNGQRPRDLIDYRFLCADEVLNLEVIDAKGVSHQIEIEKDFDEELGLEFETALFDGLIQCVNRCPFCFIDQQPPGKRETLYLKDDDYRLSFLYGSYLTLTNIPPAEWDRIAQLRLSPLYVSVHATEPEVRSRLLKNDRAAQILDHIRWFQSHRLQIHAQVVVCPGINDGPHLERTLKDLAAFHTGDVPTVISAAVVPVGLTRFRPDQDELVPVTTAKAQEVIDQVTAIQADFQAKLGTTFAWLADEWFLMGRRSLPPEHHYESYPQIGNGVGSIRLFLKEFDQLAQKLPAKVTPPRKVTWVVGNAVEHAFAPLVDRLNQVDGLSVDMVAINSDYWGQEITVTGLLTGQDVARHLSRRALGDYVLLPTVMLKQGDSQRPEDTYFLDDMSLLSLENELNCSVLSVASLSELIDACCGSTPSYMPLSRVAMSAKLNQVIDPHLLN